MPAREAAPRVLILGGTAEARALADAIASRFGAGVAVTTSLAGRTGAPALPAGRVRSGGFGGADGLRQFLAAAAVDVLIDATHPFAATMKAHARAAAAAARVPLLALDRPPWRPQAGDDWRHAADMDAAAELVRGLGRRVFLTVGARAAAAFAPLRAHWFLVRLIEPRPLPLARYELILGRGPFTVAAERALMMRHGIEVLVTKASGGAATAAKLEAARALGLPVVMLARPPAGAAETAASVGEALDWLARRIGRLTAAASSGTLIE